MAVEIEVETIDLTHDATEGRGEGCRARGRGSYAGNDKSFARRSQPSSRDGLQHREFTAATKILEAADQNILATAATKGVVAIIAHHRHRRQRLSKIDGVAFEVRELDQFERRLMRRAEDDPRRLARLECLAPACRA